MRKLVILGASIVVLAAAIATPLANAAVTYDDYRVGSVGKGDVMPLFGWNEHAFQNVVKDPSAIKFTNKLVTVKDTSWTCTDGNTYHHYYTTTSVRPLDVTPVKNMSANKITGWTLNGLSKTDFGTTTGVGTDGQRFPSYACPAGAYFTGLNVAQSHTTIVQVTNGGTSFDLPVTPVEAPAV